MRLSLILGVCLALLGVAVAQADLLNVVVNSTDPNLPAGQTNGQIYGDMLSYTRTAVNSSIDLLVVKVNNMAVMDPAAVKIVAFEGTFTSNGGMLFSADDSDPDELGYVPPWCGYTDWTSRVTSNAHNWSWVNMPITGDSSSGIPWSHSATTLYGSWSSATSTRQWSNLATVATLYVSKDAGVDFHSTLNADKRAIGGWGFGTGKNLQGDFHIPAVIVPEPSTLLLTLGGLVGLLCYAWRKRR